MIRTRSERHLTVRCCCGVYRARSNQLIDAVSHELLERRCGKRVVCAEDNAKEICARRASGVETQTVGVVFECEVAGWYNSLGQEGNGGFGWEAGSVDYGYEFCAGGPGGEEGLLALVGVEGREVGEGWGCGEEDLVGGYEVEGTVCVGDGELYAVFCAFGRLYGAREEGVGLEEGEGAGVEEGIVAAGGTEEFGLEEIWGESRESVMSFSFW